MFLGGAAALASWTALRTASAVQEWRSGLAGEPGATCRRHFVGGGERRCASRFAGVLGGLAQHGVGRELTLSAREACHRRIAAAQPN